MTKTVTLPEEAQQELPLEEQLEEFLKEVPKLPEDSLKLEDGKIYIVVSLLENDEDSLAFEVYDRLDASETGMVISTMVRGCVEFMATQPEKALELGVEASMRAYQTAHGGFTSVMGNA